MIKIGILGCGKQGEKHARVLRNINENIEIFVSDTDSSKADQLCSQFNLQYSQDLFREDLSAIIICTPLDSHAKFIKNAFEANMHVFCEKPLVRNIQEYLEIEQMQNQTGLILMTGFVYKYASTIKNSYEMMQKNKKQLGKPLHSIFRIGGRGNHQAWKHGSESGGVVNEMLIHMLDLANWFLGTVQLENVIERNCLLKQREINNLIVNCNTDDYISLQAKNSHGCIVLIQADFVTSNFCQYFEIVYEHGSIFASISNEMPSYIYTKEDGKTELNINQTNAFEQQMRAFLSFMDQSSIQTINTLKDYLPLIKTIGKVNPCNTLKEIKV